MKMDEQFNRVAEQYDEARKAFIPSFEAFYWETTKIIGSKIAAPRSILDLGAGTGLLSFYWQQQFPTADFTLIDLADDMLKIAKKRFADQANFDYLCGDYLTNFPPKKFDAIISALSIHHLSSTEKNVLFEKIYHQLTPNGLLVNYDQFCSEESLIDQWVTAAWEKQLYSGTLTESDLSLWQERRLLDQECSVAEQITTLKAIGYRQVACIYTRLKFSVIVAIK